MLSRSSMLAARGASKPSAILTSSSTPSLLLRNTLTPSLTLLARRGTATTQPTSVADGQAILASQRLKRPISPHLEIYNKEHTFFGGSIWERFTGMGFTAVLYGYTAAYLVAPLVGWHLESASVAAAFGGLPLAVKGGLKFLVAWPFTFHFINGIRHLTYDMAIGMSKRTIKVQGWTWWGVSLVTALGLAFAM